MGRKRPREIPGDDGETVVNMNVDGMPWYIDRLHDADKGPSGPAYQMNRQEGRAYMWGALAAAMLVVGVFVVFFAAVILLLLYLFNK